VTPTLRPLRLSQLTLRGWQALVLFVMGVMVLVGAAVGTVLLDRTDTMSRELIDHIQPARAAAYQLQAGLRDQETGVRGYLITADRQFLVPYYDGQRAERAAAEEIRHRLGARANLIANLDEIEQSAARWRSSYAEPLIAGVTPHAPNAPNTPNIPNGGMAERGKAQFDQLRALFEAQSANLSAAWVHAAEQLWHTDVWRDRVLIALVVVFFSTAAVLGVLVRETVTRPLAELAAACRRITEGSFAETIAPPKRPRDIRDMAIDVENMRRRMVEELEASRAARAQLDEQTEELRRSNAELEQFAYVASHDLQEPLRKVASFCQLLEKRYGDKLDERGTEYIAFAVDGAKRMQVLINDLLTFSRVGRLGTSEAEVDLDAALDAGLSNLAAAIEESGAQIVRPREPLPRVVGDPTLLTMLWQNLLGNAAKFRREDTPPRVVIECEPGAGDREGQWVFRVSDNGIGIPEEFAEKVFVIFQRLHGRDAYHGTGVGLALCKKIVEHHGGSIRLDTSYTGGTMFEFTLPMAPAHEEAVARADHAHQTQPEGAQQ
jgi:signal transduction histidine kinase